MQRFLLLSILIITTIACVKVGPDFVPPNAVLSQEWLEIDNEHLKSVSEDHQQWWSVFNDPALCELIDIAYRENLSLRTAGVRVMEASAQLGIALGEWYPQRQQAFGSAQRIRASQSVSQTESGGVFYQSELGLTAGWELDFWGKFRRAIEAADASLLGSMADYDSTLVSLTADVALSYLTIRTLQERLEIAAANVNIEEESLRSPKTDLRAVLRRSETWNRPKQL